MTTGYADVKIVLRNLPSPGDETVIEASSAEEAVKAKNYLEQELKRK